MASDDWDADNFQPSEFTAGNSKWEGEDEDDDVKDNWDDVDEDDKDKDNQAKETQPAVQQATKVKKKKALKDIIAEKEEKQKKLLESKLAEQETKSITPEEALAEKIRQQQLQEEADLQVAKETFGGITNDVVHGIETMHPRNADEFDIFRKALVEVVTKHDRSSYYISFLDALFRDVCLNLEADDIKKLGNTLHILANEKVKAAKAAKGKKKGSKVKASLVVGRANDYNDYGGEYEEFDDFM